MGERASGERASERLQLQPNACVSCFRGENLSITVGVQADKTRVGGSALIDLTLTARAVIYCHAANLINFGAHTLPLSHLN